MYKISSLSKLFLITTAYMLTIISCTPSSIRTPKNTLPSDSVITDKDSVRQPDSLYFSAVPEQITDEFHEFPLLDLKKYLHTGNNSDSLRWSFKKAKHLNIFLDEKKRVLAMRIKPDWTGSENIIFWVTSPKKDSAKVDVQFVVNSLPVLADIPDQTIGKKMKFNKIKLSSYLTDKNNRSSDIRWEISGAEKISIRIDNKNQAFAAPLDSNWTGADTVIFKAYDPYGVYAGDAVVFTVDPNYSIYNLQPNLYLRSAGSLRKLPTGEQYLVSNVHIDYKEYGVKCDTAIVNQNRTETRLFGNVLIWDTLRTVTAKRAEIFREKEKNRIYLYDDVKIDQDSIRIFGKSAHFEQQFNNATVQENVKVEYQPYPAILKSRHLIYDLQKKDLFASMVESVTATDSINRYHLTTTAVGYNDSTQIIKIPASFTLRSKQLAAKITDFARRRKDNFNSLFELPEINSSDGNTLTALKGEYNLKTGKAWLWDKISAIAVENQGKDTTRLYADTAYYDQKTKRLDLFGNVKIFRDTLRATCNLAIFYQDENKLKLLNQPEMYFGKSYVRGDSVDIFFDKDSVSRFPKKAVIKGNGFMEQPTKTSIVTEKDNLRGQQIELFFKNKKLDLVKAFGQVTSLFYLKDEDKKNPADTLAVQGPIVLKEAAGANQVTGDTLFVHLKDNKVEQILFKGGCEGTYYPKKFKKQIKKQTAKTE